MSPPNARAIFVINAENTVLGTVTLPPEAGSGTTDVALHDDALYITEALRNEVWRVKLKPTMPCPRPPVRSPQ